MTTRMKTKTTITTTITTIATTITTIATIATIVITIIARATTVTITMPRIHRTINKRLICILQNKSFFLKEALFLVIISLICAPCQYFEKICCKIKNSGCHLFYVLNDFFWNIAKLIRVFK